jgi:hypothetical protein
VNAVPDRDDAVERHLDALFDHLAGTGRDGRRLLAEAEDHLQEARADLEAAGLSPEEAADRAVARFGEASHLGRQLRAARGDWAGLGRQLLAGGWLLGALGLVAVGLSGVLAQAFGALWGARFVAGDIDGVTYTAARCADYREYFPGRSCGGAAALHHFGEVVDYRLGAGILGVLALAAYVVLRRLPPFRGSAWAVPHGPATLVGTTLFGLAALGLGVPALGQLALGDPTGTGQYLSAALVAGLAALAAAGYGLRARLH